MFSIHNIHFGTEFYNQYPCYEIDTTQLFRQAVYGELKWGAIASEAKFLVDLQKSGKLLLFGDSAAADATYLAMDLHRFGELWLDLGDSDASQSCLKQIAFVIKAIADEYAKRPVDPDEF